MNTRKLTVPLMERADFGSHYLNGICLSGKSEELMLEIRDMLNIFEPDGDDYQHGMWIEVPRGDPSEWRTFKEAKKGAEDGDYSRSDYLREWKENYPAESQWYHLSASMYNGNTFLRIVNNDYYLCKFHNQSNKGTEAEMTLFLESLAAFLRERIPVIAADVEAYNRHVDECLPKRQRTGRITRKDLDRIVPRERMKLRYRRKVIRMLKDCIANAAVYGGETSKLPSCYREPLSDMSIRIFAKYYRVAYSAYHRIKEMSPSLTDDVEFYKRNKMSSCGTLDDDTDLDSTEAFKAFALDHYGELDLSRMDVRAKCISPDNWLITFDVSYSASVARGCEIALALYEAGVPLFIYKAQKILDIIEGRDTVRLTPHTYHNYLNEQDEGGVFDLPYESQLGVEYELTREQYDEIVSLAEWRPVEPLRLDVPVPLDDPVYGMLRNHVAEPLTVCGILKKMGEIHDVAVGVYNYDRYRRYRIHAKDVSRGEFETEDRAFRPVNEVMLELMRSYVESRNGKETI